MSTSATNVEHRLLIILIQLIVIILAARIFAGLFRKIKQPAAVGELAAGIFLGPSLFGWIFPQLSSMIFLPETTTLGYEAGLVLRVLSQLGLIFLLFLMGLEFDFRHLGTNISGALGVSISGILTPFVLGVALAHLIYPHVATSVHENGFRLFMGTAMSITALPTLARMMQEWNIARTRLATITITAAAVDDAAGWILLGTVTALVRASFQPADTFLVIVETIAFALAMVYLVRPLLRRWVRYTLSKSHGQLSLNALAIMFVALFVSSAMTSLIGIFAVFGAFIFGAILSEEEEFRMLIRRLLSNFVTVFFLPIFFTYTGLRTNVTLLHSPFLWFIAASISLVAIAGKFGGCTIAAYFGGFTRKEALCIGTMMNTRALMELIVINVGYELGVLPKSVFSMLVLMALLTTVMTSPLLYFFHRGTELEPYLHKWFHPKPRRA